MVTRSSGAERSVQTDYESIENAIDGPKSTHFWASRDENGDEAYGNESSHFAKDLTDDSLTFDVSNNAILANVHLNGTIKELSVYHDNYECDSIPGVWVNKTGTSEGPLSFRIEVNGREFDLGTHGDLEAAKTELLENVLPVTSLRVADLECTLLTYPLIAADDDRVPAIVYGLHMTNPTSETITGSVTLPDAAAPATFVEILDDYPMQNPDLTRRESFEVSLDPDRSTWIPVVIAPDAHQETIARVEERTSLEWLNSTLTYFRGLLGNLRMPEDEFLQEFFERMVLLCFHSLSLNRKGEFVGSHWGSYPATDPIWMKDCYYSLLPFTILDPDLLSEGVKCSRSGASDRTVRSTRAASNTVYRTH